MHPETLKPVATVPVVKHLVSADGTAVYAEAIGNPAMPHLVFVHGFALSTVVWDCIFHKSLYANQFYLVRYDMRGHGRSGKPKVAEAYASERLAQDFAAVMEAFDLKRPVLVGWSMGATIITDIAAHLSLGTLSGAVCLSSLPHLGDAFPRVSSEFIREFAPKLLQNDDVGISATNKAVFLDSLFSRPDEIPHELKCLWLGASLAATPVDLGLAFARSQDTAPMLKMVHEGTLPLLVLQGSLDTHLDAEKIVLETKAVFKNAEVVVFKGLGHALFYEDVDGVMERIGNFAKESLLLNTE